MATPAYSDAQRIGSLGKRYFVGHHPDAWQQEGEPQQGGDFGFDLTMWLEQLGRIRGRFSIQLKSTVGLQIRSAGEEQFISVPLTKEVCNLYIQDGHPVMLVLVALDNGTSAESAKMFYTWIDADIQKRLSDRTQFDGSDPAEMTFRIPIENELARNLDISDYLKQYWSHTRLANSLRTDAGTAALKAVSALSPRAVASLGRLTPKSLDKWLVNDALDGDGLWATPKSGSLISKVKQISDLISQSSDADADRLISEVNQSTIEDAEVHAELRFQEGRLAILRRNTQAAHEKFRRAAELQPSSARYFGAELEMAALMNIERRPILTQELSARAVAFGADSDVKFQLVRIKAMEGEFVEAERILSELEGFNHRKASVLYLLIKKDWAAALKAADDGLAVEKDSRPRLFLTVLRMRALLNIVTGDDEDVSIGGRANLDIADAKRLQESTVEALREAKLAGWPANSEMLMDCASVSSVILGADDNLLELVSDFASKYPGDRHAQEALARIATLAGEPEVAIGALNRLTDADPHDAARLVLLLGESGQYQECVDMALSKLANLPHDTLIDLAIVMATLSAYRLGSIHEEQKLRSYVGQGAVAARSLLKFLEGNLKFPEERCAHLDALWTDAMEGDGDETLQDNLFLYLRPDRIEDVDRLVTLGSNVSARRGLTRFESAKYAAALLGKEEYEIAVRFTSRAISLFPEDENIGLVRAVALDRQGQSAAAVAVLRQFEGSTRKDLLQTHSTLLLRVGEVDTAVAIVKKALANASKHKDKFHFQRTLSILYGKIDPKQYVESVWRLGEIADRNEEDEEGVFLALFALATAGPVSQTNENRVIEFQDRIRNFSERFPHSTFFRVGRLPENGSGEDFIAELNKVLGIDEKTAKARQRIKNIGERIGSLIPLTLRPGGIAPYVSNVVDLLLVSIDGTYEGESSRIIVDDPVLESSEFKASPIIDLPTLIALVELDIFDKLFILWNAIAIPKISLQILSELSFGCLTIGSNALVVKVTEAVRQHKAEIVQPGAQMDDSSSFPGSEHKAISDAVSDGSFDFLTVDISTAIAIEGDIGLHGHCHGLSDLLRVATQKGVISATELRLIRLRLASWNSVGVALESEDITAAAQGVTIGHTSGDDDDKAAVRAVRRFITSVAGAESIQRAARVIVGIAISNDALRENAITWFAKTCYREFVLVGSAKFTQSADALTVSLLTLVAVGLRDRSNGIELMRMVWRALCEVRVAFGGSEDMSRFLRSLGTLAANLFDKMFKGQGSAGMVEEASYREILFSGVTPGTHDRDVIEGAYFDRAAEIQKSSDRNRSSGF